MKRQSMRAAMRCETAKNPRCKCRCGGKLHGAKRGIKNEDPAFYETLPTDDPHYAQRKRIPKNRVLKRDRMLPLFAELPPGQEA